MGQVVVITCLPFFVAKNIFAMYKITVLLENCVYKHHLKAEHGLSLMVETPSKKILFDTGSSELFASNARLLGYDIKDIDYLVLSHGHRDHTGGLHHFLKNNSTARVICKKQILERKYKLERENGIKNIDSLDLSRFDFVDHSTELGDGVTVFGDIEITNPNDTHFDKFVVEKGGQIAPDRFEDELVLILNQQNKQHIISSCSHRGITNIVSSIKRHYPNKELGLILGGFHINNAPQDKFDTIAQYMQQAAPESLGVCHCTGLDKYALFVKEFGNKVFYAHTAREIIL